ncbi:MAG: hypothetical protein ACOYEV_09800 [Candidatus Nanopelagicales bacterium]
MATGDGDLQPISSRAPRPLGVTGLGVAHLRGQVRRLPVSFGHPDLAIAVYLVILSVVGSLSAGHGARWLGQLLAFIPVHGHAPLRGTVLFIMVFLPAALAVPTASPTRGRSNFLMRMPLGARRLGLAFLFPVFLGLLGPIMLAAPALARSAQAAGSPGLLVLVQTVQIVLAGGAAAVLISAAARAALRSGALPGTSHSTITGVSALCVVGMAGYVLRAEISGQLSTPLAIGERTPAVSSALVLGCATLVLAAGLYGLPAVGLPRAGSTFGPASWRWLLQDATSPTFFHLVRALRSPRLREFTQLALLMIAALLVLAGTGPAGLASTQAENLLFIVGVTGLVVAAVGLAAIGAGAGLQRAVIADMAALCVLWVTLLGSVVLAVLGMTLQAPRFAPIVLVVAATSPLAAVLGAALLPAGNTRTQYDSASLIGASAIMSGGLLAWDRLGVPEYFALPAAGALVLVAFGRLAWRSGRLSSTRWLKLFTIRNGGFPMKAWRMSGVVGFFLGLGLCFALVLVHGMSSRGVAGLTTTDFLGITVLKSMRVLNPDGSSTVSMAPTPGLLVPLLLPVVVLGLIGFLVRRGTSRSGRTAIATQP